MLFQTAISSKFWFVVMDDWLFFWLFFSMHLRNNSIHAENPAGESRYELNCTFGVAYLHLAYRDIGKGREQDAEALPIGI